MMMISSPANQRRPSSPAAPPRPPHLAAPEDAAGNAGPGARPRGPARGGAGRGAVPVTGRREGRAVRCAHPRGPAPRLPAAQGGGAGP